MKFEKSFEQFLENLIEENTQLGDTNVFKSHLWFIFAKKKENLRLIFRFDSQVQFIKTGTIKFMEVYETYIIYGSNIINRQIGQWTKKL